jgi:hypothetical protein
MKKEVFLGIMNALDQRRTLCFEYLGQIHTTEDLAEVSLAKAAKLKQFCIDELELMTKICMVDLYHIIGMGNLSPNQMMKFTYAVQEYLSYRPRMKVISQCLDTIENLPKIPITTKFKLLGLGDIILADGEGDAVEEASVTDYIPTAVRKAAELFPNDSEDSPFEIHDNTLVVEVKKLDYFLEIMETLLNQSLHADTLKKKIDNQGEYIGIRWATGYFETADRLVATGTFVSLPIKTKLLNYLSCCNKNK